MGCMARAEGEQRRVQAAGGRGSAGLLPCLSPVTTAPSLVVLDFGGAVSRIAFSPDSYVEVLTSSTSECDCVWR